ncbi:MAG: type II secretion system F family protein [Anaerolineae bacterium]|jgi:tight adherence protein C|nr:type II secretion system F family protein [Anaerolineae bacterium]
MDPLIGILALGAFLLVSGLVYVGMREDRGRDPLQERLAQFGERELPESLEEIELQLSFRDRIVIPLVKWFANITTRFTPQKQLEATRKQLEMAGSTNDPTTFFATRIVLLVVMFFAGVFMVFGPPQFQADRGPVIQLAVVVGFAAFGFYGPVLSLRGRIRKRQENIVKALPDALDLLVICVEAGLGFDMAMGKVYEKWDNELALAFGRVLREIQLGKLRREALKDMSDRMDVPDVNSFTAAIIQADQLGVSMSKILRVQSDQMRVKRRQRAQEKAQQAPVKMMIPMVLLIFPSIWIVLLGPAALQVMALSGGGLF